MAGRSFRVWVYNKAPCKALFATGGTVSYRDLATKRCFPNPGAGGVFQQNTLTNPGGGHKNTSLFGFIGVIGAVDRRESIDLKIQLEGVVVIVGNYGSGKTEVAINLAVHRRRDGVAVRLADLDLVNPYFRTREARSALAALGIDIVLPPHRYRHADLPILDPAVAGLIRQPFQLTILDAGGDDVGATVLASLHHVLEPTRPQVLQVINPMRPFTETHAGCLRIQREIEAAARLKVTGLIGNANLIDETVADHVVEGYHFVKSLAEETGLPLVFVTAPAHLAAACGAENWICPLLPIERQLVPPWKRPVDLGPPS